jgi:hypothetical protein
MAIASIFGRQQIAGPGIVPTGSESAPNGPGKFAGDQYPHNASPGHCAGDIGDTETAMAMILPSG